MNYAIEIKPAAMKALAGLPRADQQRIRGKIEALANNPRPVGVVKLSGPENLYRVRSGDYRVVYQICDRILVVVIIRIGHRREVYR